MAQILVTNEKNSWYHGIASLRNYYEVDVEKRILKHKNLLFSDYYAIKCKFTFINTFGEKSVPDLLLISKDFKKWVIVELELGGKGLSHTRMQLRVFTSPSVDGIALATYCIKQLPSLKRKKSSLNNLFSNYLPEVLVIFDTYNSSEMNKIEREFDVKICVFELYNSYKHDYEVYRFSGNYPYVTANFSFLKDRSDSFEIYDLQKPHLINNITKDSFDVLYRTETIRLVKIVDNKNRHYIKIPNNKFPPGKTLRLIKTINNKFVIDIM